MTDPVRAELLQRQARALGDPTRHGLFRLIEESAEAPSVRDLAEATGLHHSAVRQHLAKLVGAELVLETRQQPSGPGRPSSVYRRAPGVAGVWGTDNPFERLAALLVDVVRTGKPPRTAGREAGRVLARTAAAPDADQARTGLEALVGFVDAQGFEPTVDDTEGSTALVLGHCPFAALALAAPEVVCQLHRGLSEGMADAADCPAPVEVTGLTMIDPIGGGCRIEVRPRSDSIDSEYPKNP